MNLVELVLTAVEEQGDACVFDIAEAMQIPASIVVDVFRQLEAEGLLKAL